MRRWLPYPLLALGLFIMWLLLNQSLAPGHLALAGATAVLASRSMATRHPEKPRIRARAIPRLAWIVAAATPPPNTPVPRSRPPPPRPAPPPISLPLPPHL